MHPTISRIVAGTTVASLVLGFGCAANRPRTSQPPTPAPSAAGAPSQVGLQLDAKGVEFGPWIRAFAAQVKRHWFVPLQAISYRGHVEVSFDVHRDGVITDVVVRQSSGSEPLDKAALSAVSSSSPTQSLPPAYPDDKVHIVVTFYYNESPGLVAIREARQLQSG
jgi:TonB family protein